MCKRKDCCAAIGAALFLLFVLSRPGFAHRVNVFAYVEGDGVQVECSYSKSDRVRFGDIEVKNAATGKVYLTGKTDEKGKFSFPVPPEARAAKADLTILLRSGEGHQNDWIVKADEYLSAAPAAVTTPPAPSVSAVSPSASDKPAAVTQSPAQAAAPKPTATPTAASAAPMDPAALQAVVEAAVEKKIAPLRKILLDEKEKGPGLTEIFGGIGYLVGIAGLLAYARSRKAGCGS
jgi:nickel transport protein